MLPPGGHVKKPAAAIITVPVKIIKLVAQREKYTLKQHPVLILRALPKSPYVTHKAALSLQNPHIGLNFNLACKAKAGGIERSAASHRHRVLCTLVAIHLAEHFKTCH